MAMTKVVVALVLIAAAGAEVMDRETYDDVPGDMELMYPEQNYVDPSEPEPESVPIPTRSDPKARPTSQPRKYEDISNARKMLLYKMIMALRNHDASPSFLSVPKWIATGTVLVPPDTFNYSHLKGPLGPMFKRAYDETWKRPKADGRPIQKWNIEKGKPGSAMLCYFKLCGYHPSRETA